MSGLRAAGVEFDTFELEGITWQDGVAHIGVSRVVWFRDPDGNHIAVSSQITDAG